MHVARQWAVRSHCGGGGGLRCCSWALASSTAKTRSLEASAHRDFAKRAGGSKFARGALPIIKLDRVRKVLPDGRVIFEKLSLQLIAGAKIGVIGANGSGKTTLLRLLAGVETDFEGHTWRPEGLSIGVLEQEPQLDNSRSVIDNVMDGVTEARDLLRRFDAINEHIERQVLGEAPAAVGSIFDKNANTMDADKSQLDMDELIDAQADVSERIETLGCWNLHALVKASMEALGCPPAEAMPGNLSGGQRRRVALCRLLLSSPELLLLDEPTNHLDTASVGWLEQRLAAHRGAVVCVTHDRYFLDNVASHILEVEGGTLHTFQGNYSQYLKHKAQRIDLADGNGKQNAHRINNELQWIRKASLCAGKVPQARQRQYERLLQEKDVERDAQLIQAGAIAIVPGPRLGSRVLNVESLSKAYGKSRLFQELSLTLPPGAVMGVIGPNGVGKSTLIKIIAGEETADAGTLTLGSTVVLGHVNQSRHGLDPLKSVYEEISQGLDLLDLGGGRTVSMRQYVATFNLRGPTQEKLVSKLSGGERGRVHLAKTLRDGCNFLLLDEPSNDLDVDTLRSLEEAIRSFAGSAVIVSHDRWFLDRVCDCTLAFDAGGSVEFFEGNVSSYYAWRDGRTRKEDALKLSAAEAPSADTAETLG